MTGHVAAEGTSRTRAMLLIAGALGSLAVVLALTLSWHTVDSRIGPQLYAVLVWVEGAFGLPRATAYRLIEWGSNVALFVPLGGFARALLPRFPTVVVLAAGVSLTLAIEFVQAVALTERTPSMLDVLANSLGFGAGMWIARVSSRRARTRDTISQL